MTLEEYKNNLDKQLNPQETVITHKVEQYRDIVKELQLKARNDSNMSTQDFVALIYHCSQQCSKGQWYEWEKDSEPRYDFYRKKLILLKKAYGESWIDREDYEKYFNYYIDKARNNSNISLADLIDLINCDEYSGEYEL